MVDVIIENLDLWSSAIINKSTAGRGTSDKQTAYGIKKLRDLILELAVLGKLVSQDPNDIPARELLKEIESEKQGFIKAGKFKAPKTTLDIDPNKLPYILPIGWEWIRLGNCSQIERGGSPRPIEAYLTNDVDGLNWIKIGDTQKGCKFITSTREKIKKEGLVKTRMVYPGDFLLTNSMSFGRPYISLIEGCIHDGWLRIHPPALLDKDYLYNLLQSPYVTRFFAKAAAGAVVQNLNADKVRELLIALPPFEEQKRIAAKVNELMALCDQLEQQQTDSIAAHQILVQTLLDTLTQASDTAEFEQAWSRIADHFDTLFTTEASIDQLKQTLLQLAVMGKLVPQDPNDEAASVLLKNVVQEKSELIKGGILKTQKPLPPVSEDAMSFKLPIGWAWTRLDNLSLHSEAGWSPNCESTPREGENWGVLKVSSVTWGKFKPEENKSLPQAFEPKPEFEVMAGDFLISRANTAELVARAVIVPEKSPIRLMMSDKIIRFVFSKKISSEFINLVNASDHSRSYYAKVAGGTSSSMKNVSREQIRMLVIALPPLAEQHRIVAKVDELMALCDTLKARIVAAQTTQLQLADAIVEQAVA